MDKIVKSLTRQLDLVLNSDDVSEEVKDAISDILCECANEGNAAIFSPQIIGLTFPFILESLGREYGRGVVMAIRSIIESLLINKEIRAELTEINDSFYPNRERKTDEVLDSEVLREL